MFNIYVVNVRLGAQEPGGWYRHPKPGRYSVQHPISLPYSVPATPAMSPTRNPAPALTPVTLRLEAQWKINK